MLALYGFAGLYAVLAVLGVLPAADWSTFA